MEMAQGLSGRTKSVRLIFIFNFEIEDMVETRLWPVFVKVYQVLRMSHVSSSVCVCFFFYTFCFIVTASLRHEVPTDQEEIP